MSAFRTLPLLYIFCGLAVFGFVVDLRSGTLAPRFAPQLPWVLLFGAWCLLTAAIKAPSSLASGFLTIAITFLLYFIIAHGVQTLRALELTMGVLLACVLFVASVGVHQGLSPFGCIAVDEASASELSAGKADGRPCHTRTECSDDDPEPGMEYRCERVGLLGTTTIGGGRIRYLGVLQDPNEMSLAVCIGLPIAFAFFERKRSISRGLLLAFSFVVIAVSTVMTQSRGGQLVFLTVTGAYFLRRFGWRGLLAGVPLALPMLLLGGRGGEEAESSSLERLECWFEGMSMWRQWPLLGVGFRQFTEHHYLTAHNSYVLASAEIGLPGFILWTAVLYISVKIPALVLSRLDGRPEAGVARIWAMAMLASLAGLLVGVFFLSFCYHYVLWIYVGLAGALYSAVRAHDPSFRVRFGAKDLAVVVAFDLVMIVVLYVYTRLKAP